MQSNKNTAIYSICANPVSLHTYEYIINNNKNNRHYTDKKEIYEMISPFFVGEGKKLQAIWKLLSEYQAFEVSVEDKKIFKLENDLKAERSRIRRDRLRNYLSVEDYHNSKE